MPVTEMMPPLLAKVLADLKRSGFAPGEICIKIWSGDAFRELRAEMVDGEVVWTES